MLIVIPSLVILFLASLVVMLINFLRKDEEHEKRVVREEHLYNKNNPELS